MDLEEFDELIERLVESFGLIDPYSSSFSEEDIIDLIDDADPDNVGYYISLLKDMDIIFETSYPDDVNALPSGKRYMMGSSAMEWHLRREESKRQKWLTISLVIFAVFQIILVIIELGISL